MESEKIRFPRKPTLNVESPPRNTFSQKLTNFSHNFGFHGNKTPFHAKFPVLRQKNYTNFDIFKSERKETRKYKRAF